MNEGNFKIFDAYTWVYRIVDSCLYPFHFDAANILIRLFWERYHDHELYSKLIELRDQKLEETKN